MPKERHEIKVGLMIVICLIAVVALSIYVGNFGQMLSPKDSFNAYFSNVMGLRKGDPVYYAGMKVGSVTALNVEKEHETKGKTPRVVVAFEIDKRYPITTRSQVSVARTITGITSVEIKPSAEGERIEDGGVIDGADVSTFTEIGQEGGDLLRQGKEAIALITSVINELFGEQQMTELKQTIKNVSETSESTKKLAARIEGTLDEERAKKFQSTLDNVEQISAGVRNVLGDSEQKDLKTLVHNLSETSKRTNELADKITGLVGKGDELIDDSRGDIRQAVIHVRKTAEHLEATAQDVRRHPWKLLNKPSSKELKVSALYDAARQLNESADALDRGVERLIVLTDKPKPATKDQMDKLNEIMGRLKEIMQQIESSRKKIQERVAKTK